MEIFSDIFEVRKKNLCDMQQRIISRVIGNLVERPAIEVPHLRATCEIFASFNKKSDF